MQWLKPRSRAASIQSPPKKRAYIKVYEKQVCFGARPVEKLFKKDFFFSPEKHN